MNVTVLRDDGKKVKECCVTYVILDTVIGGKVIQYQITVEQDGLVLEAIRREPLYGRVFKELGACQFVDHPDFDARPDLEKKKKEEGE